MDIREEQHGAVTVLTPKGPLAQEDAGIFAARVAERAASLLGRVVIDASSIAYADSKGLEAILAISEQLESAGHVLRAANVNATVREALELTGLTHCLECYDDLNTAVRSFA